MTCKDCNHHLHNYHDKYVCTNKNSDCYGLNTDDDDSCALCEADWIRVEDRLPETSGMAVVVSDGSGYELAEWDGTDFFTMARYFSDLRNLTDEVKLWYPLPELPED